MPAKKPIDTSKYRHVPLPPFSEADYSFNQSEGV